MRTAISTIGLALALGLCVADQIRIIRATPVEPWPASSQWDDTTGCGEYLPLTVDISARCRACGAC